MNKKILIIEDDQFIRDLYAHELQKEGYAVTTCEDAEKGAKELTQNSYDLILLDIMLPGKSGLDFMKDYLEKKKKNAKNFILLTNIGQDAVIKQALELGASGYFIKSSYAPHELVREINNYFEE